MAAPVPIRLQEAFSLTASGVNPAALTFAATTLESDKYVCVREASPTDPTKTQVVLVDTTRPTTPLRRPISADSALMNPTTKVIALKNGTTLQLFDFASKSKLKSYAMAEPVVFWKWLDSTTVGIVTASAVFHWNTTDPSSPPEPMFDRHASLSAAQIINYRSSPDGQWLVLVGIAGVEGGKVAGRLQLYSVAKKLSQPIEGHAAAFASLPLEGVPTTLFLFSTKPVAEGAAPKLHIIEVGADTKADGAPRFEKKAVSVYYAPESGAADFPVSLQVSTKYSLAFLLTKAGYAHVYDIESAECLYQNRVSESTPFVSAPHEATGGVMTINRKGQVLVLSVVPENVVPYVMSKLQDVELATRLASRNGFPGAERLFAEHFAELFDEERWRDAALVAAESPAGSLRTEAVIARFKAAPSEEGAPSPLLIYFQALLERGPLNALESVELAAQLLSFGRAQLLEKWLKENKLGCSEELGDMLRPHNVNLALAVYIKAPAHPKVVQCLLETGQTAKVALYVKKVGLDISHTQLVQMASAYSPAAALELANALQAQGALVPAGGGPTPDAAGSSAQRSGVDHTAMFDMFMNKGMLQEATSYCLDNLKGDLPGDGELQTRVLEANLVNAPQVADAILSQDVWHHYDKHKIALLAERAGLFQHALENFSDLADVKRVMGNTHVLNPEFLLNYFANLSPDDGLECLKELISANPRGNLELCVTIGAKYTEAMGADRLMEVFRGVKLPDALFFYLGAVVNTSQDPEVHFQFIDAACKLQRYDEAERVTRESSFYDPERVKVYLMEARLRDPRPLINVCDRFDFVDDLVRFLMKNNQVKFVEGYVQRVNPTRCPEVVGALLDLDADDEIISRLILSVKNMTPVAPLVAAVESRGRLKLLLPFLESRVGDGATDAEVHSGVAKCYVESNINPQHFLETNPYYDSRDVGRFCEKRDPFLAYVAYKRGACDDELLAVTNAHALYKDQARYLVDRESGELWATVLNEENQHRRAVIDQVIATALPETAAPEKVSAAVKAFMQAELPGVLIELLEKLVLQTSNTAFSRNRNLQNLLILTAIKADPPRVMEYVRRLDAYDAEDVASVAVSAGLFEEAFAVFQKADTPAAAIGILLQQMNDFERAADFATKADRPDVWSALGVAQLEAGHLADGVTSLLRAKDPAPYAAVISAAREAGGSPADFALVVKFLKFSRTKVKDIKAVDTEIVYALAKCDNRLTEIEEFVSQPNAADLEEVGDRCVAEELYPAAKLLFSTISNFGKLAPVLVRLGEFAAAVEAAKKADRVRTWRAVTYACVDAEQFRLAHICGLHLVIEAEELQDTIEYYTDRGHYAEIIELLEAGLTLDRAHTSMFTELGVLLSKHRPDSMMEHCKMWWQKCNLPRLVRACEVVALWAEVVYLHIQYGEYDNAATTMMAHSPDAWSPSGFTEVITKAGNLDVMYRAVGFYLDQQPSRLNELLSVLAPKIESSRAVSILRSARGDVLGPLGALPLAKAYLLKASDANVPDVNEALHDVLIAEEAVDELSEAVTAHDNFDQLALARRLQSHSLLAMRRVACTVFRRNGKYEQALAIAKADKLYKEAIDTVAASTDAELTEELAEFFLESGLREAFTATLFTCFEYFRPDVALEQAWRYGVMDWSMPYMIQTLKEVAGRIMGLEEESKDKRDAVEEARKEEEEAINDDPSVLLYGLQPGANAGPSVPMIMAPPGGGGGTMNSVPQITWTPQAGPSAAAAAANMQTFAMPGQ